MNPLKYTLSNSFQKGNIKYLIDEFSEQLKHISGKCMDIGCGPGDATKNILLPALNLNAEIVGTDISEHMIEYANKTYADEKQLKFEVLNIETKNLPEKYVSEFDCILSFHTLHWVQDVRQAFKNIYNMLRPDGKMLVLFICSSNVQTTFEVMEQDIRFASYTQNTKCITPFYYFAHPRKELKRILQNIGFTVSHCSLRDGNFITNNPDEHLHFLDSIIAIIPFLNKMPHELRQEYEDKFAHEYTKNIFYKKCEKIVSLDLYKISIAYAQKNIN